MYVGLWYGGPNYSTGSWADDTEVFPTIEAAGEVLQDRDMNRARWATIKSPDRVNWDEAGKPTIVPGSECWQTPDVDGSEMTLIVWNADMTLHDLESGYPDIILTLDSEGDVVRENC